jgi:large conductance mechanosensitive channel
MPAVEIKERVVRQFAADFKKFILRGNVLDLAVAVVVGAAFNAVVQSFANDVLMGFVGAIFGKPNFSNLEVHLRGCTGKGVAQVCNGTVAYGKFLTNVLNFLIIALAVFVVIKTFEKLHSLRTVEEPEPEPLTRSEELLTEIRDSLVESSS